MKRKTRSPFATSPGLKDSKVKKEKKNPTKDKPDLTKTSFDPLYDTTDRYRKVCKPMDVEDFLTKER